MNLPRKVTDVAGGLASQWTSSAASEGSPGNHAVAGLGRGPVWENPRISHWGTAINHSHTHTHIQYSCLTLSNKIQPEAINSRSRGG